MREVVLGHRLGAALLALNPDVPGPVRVEAHAAMVKDRSVMDRVRANREVYDLLRDGYQVEWLNEEDIRPAPDLIKALLVTS